MYIFSSGRDNQLHVYSIPDFRTLTSEVLPSRIQTKLPLPELLDSLDINSLNFCSFSALANDDWETLVAVPHTVDSGYIDIYNLKTKKRIATAIGKGDLQTKGVQATRAGEDPLEDYLYRSFTLFACSHCHVVANAQSG